MHDVPRKLFAPAVEVLCCVYVSLGRVFLSQRQNSLPGLGKVWEPTPVARNHRKVARKGVI